MTTDPTADIRRREIAETLPPVNEKFAQYTQSAAFSISLSRTMIGALRTAEFGIEHGAEYMRLPVSDGALAALVRRGLIVCVGDNTRRFDGDQPRQWRDVWQITTAGTLMLDLLAEAGLVERAAVRRPLPPPPPEWLDPRPRLVVGADGQFHTLPSRRSEARAQS